MKPLLLLTVLGVVACGVAGMQAESRDSKMPRFTYCLSAENVQAVGGAAIVEFALNNRSDFGVYVLKWYSPLEGLLGDIFKLTRNGRELHYAGMMMKRGASAASDYAFVPSKGELVATVDLSQGYRAKDLIAGDYEIAFRYGLTVFDWSLTDGNLAKSQNRHRSVEVKASSSCRSATFQLVSG